jgi:hypothetical protein
MARSQVIVDNRWRQYRAELDREIERSMGQAAGVALAAGIAKPSRYAIDSIQHNARIEPARRIPGGWQIVIRWPDFRAVFFDKGTYAKLGGRARLQDGQRRGRTKATHYQWTKVGNRGVKPQRFTLTAKKAGLVALVAALQRNLR